MVLAQVLFVLALAAPSSSLVGKWGGDGEVFFELKENGKGTMEDENIKWEVRGDKLRITDSEGDTEEITFRLEGNRLIISMEGMDLPLQRVGAKATAKSEPAQSEAPATKAGSDQLSRLLLSSPWCSFSYSQASGTTRTTRVVFLADGSWSLSGNRETSSSGPNGSYFGSSNSGGAGRWAVKNGQLMMSNPPEAMDLVPIALQVKQNSNGYPIITANGVEYSMCR